MAVGRSPRIDRNSSDPATSTANESRPVAKPLLGLLCALSGAIAFSGKAIIVKLLYRYPGTDAATLLALRMLVALPFFIGIAIMVQRRPKLAPLIAADIWKIMLLGFLGYYLASYLDFLGLQYISATLERLILYLGPSMVLLLAVAIRGYRVSRRQILALAISYLGVALAFVHDFLFATKIPRMGSAHVALGSALAFGSAVSYSFYLFGSGELVRRIGTLRLTAHASGVACLCSILQYLWLQPINQWHKILEFPLPVYWLSLLNGTVCTVLPIFLVMLGISRLGATSAAQIGMVGPLSTIVLSTIFLGERIGSWQIAGTVLVMTGVFVTSQRR